MSKLRRLLGPVLAAQPYRLLADVTADFLEVERLVLAGDVPARCAPTARRCSSSPRPPRLVQARNELEGALRRAALLGGQDTLWAWLETESGRDDVAAPARVPARGAARRPARPGRAGAPARRRAALG